MKRSSKQNVGTGLAVKKKQSFCMDIPKIKTSFGDVLVCGQGDTGQLGLGDSPGVVERKRPALVTTLQQAVEVVAGGMHNLVLTANGDVYSFGCNDEGALGRDCSKDGSEFLPALVNLPDKAVKISAGDSHSACLLQDGRVFAWGSFRDSHGNMGLTLEGNKRTPVNVLPSELCCDIASGSDHLVMLTVKGRVYTVGCGEQGQLGRVTLRSASGESRRGKTELLQPGQVYIKGNLVVNAIWATSYGTFMRVNESIYACGLNNYKQLLVKKNAETIPTPTKIVLENVKEIVGGQHHTIVLKDDGKCFAIGRCDYGRLGLGDIKTDIKELRQIMALDKKFITNVASGEAQSFAVTDNGQIYAWGMGSNHQLGLPTDEDALVPTLVSSMQTVNKRILQVSSGGQHSILIASTNTENSDAKTATDAVKKELPITKKRNSLNTPPNVSKKSKKTESTTLKEKNGTGSDTETAGKSTIDTKSTDVTMKDNDEVKNNTTSTDVTKKDNDEVKNNSEVLLNGKAKNAVNSLKSRKAPKRTISQRGNKKTVS